MGCVHSQQPPSPTIHVKRNHRKHHHHHPQRTKGRESPEFHRQHPKPQQHAFVNAKPVGHGVVSKQQNHPPPPVPHHGYRRQSSSEPKMKATHTPTKTSPSRAVSSAVSHPDVTVNQSFEASDTPEGVQFRRQHFDRNSMLRHSKKRPRRTNSSSTPVRSNATESAPSSANRTSDSKSFGAEDGMSAKTRSGARRRSNGKGSETVASRTPTPTRAARPLSGTSSILISPTDRNRPSSSQAGRASPGNSFPVPRTRQSANESRTGGNKLKSDQENYEYCGRLI